MTDRDLVHAAWAGDAVALGALLERHRAPLYASALSILRDRGRAQDAVQDAFLIALGRLSDLREPAAAGAWLRAIVRSRCLMSLRASREQPADVPVVDPGDGLDPERALERLALRDWVWAALDRLPADLRATVMLRFFTGRAFYAEIAAVLGIPVGTVRSRLNQAKRRLADALLDAASATHDDHAALVRRRWEELTAGVEQMEHEGRAALYLADCSSDVLVEVPSRGSLARGTRAERRNIEDGLAAGVRLRLTNIVASPGVTIVEGHYQNPPDDPGHCPPAHTEIRFQPRNHTIRVVVHFGPEAGSGWATPATL